ncbi:MAG TPA: hypothetical protein VNP73_12070, partial [Actinomycetota bacterium]|nr:hypothetical protein [Actinomycetota bacterium]
MEPVELLLAVAQAVLFLLVGLVLSERFLLRLDAGMEVGGPERLLFGIVGGVGFAASLMVGNIITGGAVFGLPFFVPIVAALCLLVGWKALRVPRGIQWAPLIVITVALVLLFAVPSMAGGSVIRTGDSPWHLGWSQQLLGGEPIPSGPAAGYGRNAYPWGWHALTATLVRLVPGSTIVTAYSALQLLLLFALPLAGACLSRRLDPAAGWPGAIAMSLVGGFGWVTAQGAAFVATPAHSRFGADLVVASPNSVYELFAPPLPRELGVVLLAATATMMVLALRQGGRTHALAAGVCAGLLGLVSVPLFLSAIVWFAIVSMLGIGKRGQIGFALLPAFVIFLLWAGPVLANYAAYGGFVNITPSLGKEWDLVTALQSWGFLFPLAMIGVWVALKNPSSRPMVAFGIGTAMMLGAASARASFDWT